MCIYKPVLRKSKCLCMLLLRLTILSKASLRFEWKHCSSSSIKDFRFMALRANGKRICSTFTFLRSFTHGTSRPSEAYDRWAFKLEKKSFNTDNLRNGVYTAIGEMLMKPAGGQLCRQQLCRKGSGGPGAQADVSQPCALPAKSQLHPGLH